MLHIKSGGRFLIGVLSRKQLDYLEEIGSTLFLIITSFLVGKFDGEIEKTASVIFTISINYIFCALLEKLRPPNPIETKQQITSNKPMTPHFDKSSHIKKESMSVKDKMEQKYGDEASSPC